MGISENKINNTAVSIFPNPANNVLTVSISDYNITEPVVLKIRDLCGRMVKEEKINAEQQDIDLKEISKSVYIITITRNKELLYKGKVVRE